MVLTTRLKVLSAVAAAIGIFILVTRPDPATTAGAVVQPRSERSNRITTVSAPRNVSSTSGPDSRDLLARLSRRVTAGESAPALFHSQSWYVAPPPPPPAPPTVYVAPPPTAPPLPFGVMGSYTRPGDPTIYFLTRGDRVFDVRVGDTIDNTYSVDSAANGQLVLTYKPLNTRQTLSLGGSQ